jgi:GAF domain-containing protein
VTRRAATTIAAGAFAALSVAHAQVPQTQVRKPEDQVFRAAVEMVSLNVTVVDAKNRYITDLTRDDFIVVLRWEVVGYLVTCLGAGVVIWSLNTLSPPGWIAILLTLCVVGLFARTLIEEAIAAEDLNKVHLMQSVVTGNVSLQTAFEQIEQFAYRLIDWDDMRVYRVEGGTATLAYHGRIGRPGRGEPDQSLDPVRQRVVADGHVAVLGDARREVGMRSNRVASVVIQPLKFAEEVIGTLEILHRKERFYRNRDVAALTAVAGQISSKSKDPVVPTSKGPSTSMRSMLVQAVIFAMSIMKANTSPGGRSISIEIDVFATAVSIVHQLTTFNIAKESR